MLRRFTSDEVTSLNQMKSSCQRSIRTRILQLYPRLINVIDDILPKKKPLILAKCPNHIQGIVVSGTVVFFQHRDGPWVPNLRIIHKYPSMLPKMQVDYGAIRHVLRGSNVMCPGLLSQGGRMEPDIPAQTVVQIVAEGKANACAVGIMTLSTEEIKKVNKGVCIETLHTLGDGLWNAPSI